MIATTVAEMQKQIEETASIMNHQETRVIDVIKNGQAIRQGDVYLTKIPEVPKSFSKTTSDLKLAPGETKGSRHVLVQTPSLKLFVNPDANALQGPVVKTQETLILTHPEHAHFSLPAGIYSCTYQRDFAQEELAAVRD